MSCKGKKKQIVKTVSVVDIGCNSCKKPNLSSIFFNPFPKKHRKPATNYIPCHSSTATTPTTASSSKATDTDHWYSDTSSSSPFRGSHQKAVAVEKDSDDPYLDFRQSMLQMVLQNEIYSKNDLRELLSCFLRLNEPYHHGIILRAFTEIWDGVFSARRGDASPLVRGYGVHVSRDSYY